MKKSFSRFSAPFTAVLFVSCSAIVAVADPGLFDHSGVQMLAHLTLADFGPQNIYGNDSWGYVSPTGREYVLMGLSDELAVVEITTPTSPVIVGSVPHTHGLWSDVKVFGDHAFVVNEEAGGVQSIDLSGVDAGVVTLDGTFFAGAIPTSHNIAINEASGYAYLCGPAVSGEGIVAIDLSNPVNLTVAGQWSIGIYVHDAQIVSYTDGPYAGREIAFCAAGPDGLYIVDVTDKANMFTVSSITYPNLGYTHQGWLNADRSYFYLNDEEDELFGLVSSTTTRVIDVSDLANPTLASVFTNGVQSIDHNLYIRDGILYESNYTSGLRLFDLRDPAEILNPSEIGYFDTSPAAPVAIAAPAAGIEHADHPDGVGSFQFGGAWNVVPFFPSGVVAVSDLDSGLFILDPSEALKLPNPADLNGDGVVNGADLAILLIEWGNAGASDFNNDGVINGADLAILLTNWG